MQRIVENQSSLPGVTLIFQNYRLINPQALGEITGISPISLYLGGTGFSARFLPAWGGSPFGKISFNSGSTDSNA